MQAQGSAASFLSREKPIYSKRRGLKKVYDNPAVFVNNIFTVMGLLRSSSIGFLGPVSPGSLSLKPRRTFLATSSGRYFSTRSGSFRFNNPFSAHCNAATATTSFVLDRRGTMSSGRIAREGYSNVESFDDAAVKVPAA